jgi:hypothetical protein
MIPMDNRTPVTKFNAIIKQVNVPQELAVKERPDGFPVAIAGNNSRRIISIERRWRIDDEWWRTEPISRMYYAVILDSGKALTIFKDLIKNRWYRQSY